MVFFLKAISNNHWNNFVDKVHDMGHAARNTALLIRDHELFGPLRAVIQRPIEAFRTTFFTMQVVCDPFVIQKFLEYPRNDHGPFDGHDGPKFFLPLLRELFPGVEIKEDDFILTVSSEMNLKFRQAFNFLSEGKHDLLMRQFAHEFVSVLNHGEPINISKISIIYTCGMISRLFLGCSLSLQQEEKIAQSIQSISKHQKKTQWKEIITHKETSDYTEALKTIHDYLNFIGAQNHHEGSFIHALKVQGLSELQIKTTLFELYFAGATSTASIMTYLLWQLGQHKDFQTNLEQTIAKVLAEALRLFCPVYVIPRNPAFSMEYSIQGEEGRINRHDKVMLCPALAGRNPNFFSNPECFDPERYTSGMQIPYSWHPYGYGPNECPAQEFSKRVIKYFVSELNTKYKFDSSPAKEPRMRGHLALELIDDVFILLKPLTTF